MKRLNRLLLVTAQNVDEVGATGAICFMCSWELEGRGKI